MKIVISIVVFLLVSCSSTIPEPKEAVETGPTVKGVWVCEDEAGDAIRCQKDSDCCSGGFVCVPDREKGRNVNVCIFDSKAL